MTGTPAVCADAESCSERVPFDAPAQVNHPERDMWRHDCLFERLGRLDNLRGKANCANLVAQFDREEEIFDEGDDAEGGYFGHDLLSLTLPRLILAR